MRARDDKTKMMSATRVALGWLLILATAGLGCNAALGGESGAATGEDGDTPSWINEQPDEVPDDADDKSEDGDDGDDAPDGPMAESTPCAPRPRPVSQADEAPEIPEEVRRGQCPLRSEKNIQLRHDGEAGKDVYKSVQWKATESGYRKVLRGRGGRHQATVDFELEGSEIRRIRKQIDDVYYGNGRGLEVWNFDARDRLTKFVSKRWATPEKSELTELTEIEQSFSEGRLAKRTRTTKGSTRKATRSTTTWNYDEDGRLTGARYRSDSGTTARVEWRYEQGRPTGVTRFVDGIPVFVQAWTFREDGSLASRSVEYSRRGLKGARQEALPSPPALDDMAAGFPHRPQNVYGIMRNIQPWNASVEKDAERGCSTLPTSVGHGYPTKRRAYRIIWEDVEMSDIGAVWTYGLDGFGTESPGITWYGHGGALGGRPAGARLHSENLDRVRTTIEYDARGRMVAETVRRERADGRNSVLKRSRDFGPDGLTRDGLLVGVSEPANETVTAHRRTLRFERDARGRLARRSLFVDGTRVAYQTFEYDAEGRWTGLKAFGRGLGGGTHGALTRLTRPVDVSEAPGMRSTVRYARKLDTQGRPVYQLRKLPGHHSRGVEEHSRGVEKRTEWGPHGPIEVVSRDVGFRDLAPTRQRFHYDSQGHKVRMVVDRRSDGKPEVVHRWKRGADGRVIAKIEEDRRSERLSTVRYSYACSGS